MFPVSLIYGAVTFIRNLFFDLNFFKEKRFDVHTIGVGNLSVGGTYNGVSLGDTGWTQITSFSNGFSAVSGQGVYYRRLNNVVWLRGAITGGSANTAAFTLPSGYRPATQWVVPVQNYGSSSDNYITIQADGVVNSAASSNWLQCSFPLS